MKLFRPIIVVICLLAAGPGWGRDLPAAWDDAGAVRSVFFVRGMTCRACTMILDLRLNRSDGVHWARFDYPLRLLTVYHDPRKVPVQAIAARVGRSGELEAEVLASGPVPWRGRSETVVSWRGGAFSLGDARAALAPFEPVLDREFGPDHPERAQVVYEVVSEIVRNRILLAEAGRAGYVAGAPGGTLPPVIDKDFYWPESMRPVTPEEAAVGRFVREQVMEGLDGREGRRKFDAWLLGLWRRLDLDVRAEGLEVTAAPR